MAWYYRRTLLEVYGETCSDSGSVWCYLSDEYVICIPAVPGGGQRIKQLVSRCIKKMWQVRFVAGLQQGLVRGFKGR